MDDGPGRRHHAVLLQGDVVQVHHPSSKSEYLHSCVSFLTASDVLSLRGGQCPEASGHCPPLKHPFVAHVRGLPAGSYVSLHVLCVSSDRKYPHAVHQDE